MFTYCSVEACNVPLIGQLTPAQVVFSPLLSTMSRPRVLYGPLKDGDVLLVACRRALYWKAVLLEMPGKYPAETTAAASAVLSKTRGPSMIRG